MNVLLFLEHRFYQIGEDVYCERIIDYTYLTRYLQVFEKVTVCARFGKDIPEKKIRTSGPNVDFLPLPDFVGTSGIVRNISKINKVLKRNLEKYDAIIIRTPSPISLISFCQVKKANKPLAIEVVINPKTMFCKDSYHSFLQPFVANLFVLHTKKICDYANGVSYVTEHVLQEMYPCKAMKEDNGKYFTSSYSTINLFDKNYNSIPHVHKDGTSFCISHTGYMDTYSKGHKNAIDVVAKLVEAGIDVELNFIGSGDLEKEFREYACFRGVENKVHFLGNLVGFDRIKEVLELSDLFLFPTCSEGLPRALIEAMANSVACISSPIDGIVELLPTECLVDYRDIEGMYEKVRAILIDDKYRCELAKANYSTALKYHYDKMLLKRNEFYEKLRWLAIKDRNDD